MLLSPINNRRSPPLHVGELREHLAGGGGGHVGHGGDAGAGGGRRGRAGAVVVGWLVGPLGRVGVLQLERVLEVPEHVAHGDPVAAELGEALLGGLGELVERLLVHRPGELGVHDLLDEALPLPLHPPLGEADLLARQLRVDGRPRAQRLEEHDAEGVDVGLVRQLLAPEVLRVEVAEAALDGGADVQLVHPGAVLGQPKVGYLCDEVVVEEDVGGLDVAVDDPLRRAGVQVVEAAGGADADLQPLLPRQRRQVLAVDVVAEGAIVHVLVDEDHLGVLVAVADEGDEVAVAELGQHLDLGVELVDPLLRLRVPALHGDLGAVVDLADVDVAEAADADDGALLEVLGRGLDLGEGEEAAEAEGGGEGVAALAGPALAGGEGLAGVDGEQPRREAVPALPVLGPLVPLDGHGSQAGERAEHHREPHRRHGLAAAAAVVGLLPVHAELAVEAPHRVAHLEHLHAAEQRVHAPRVLPHRPHLDAQLVRRDRRVDDDVLVVRRRQLAGHRRQVQPGDGLAPVDEHVEVEVVHALAHDVREEEPDQVAERRVHLHLPRHVEARAPHAGVRHLRAARVHLRRRHQLRRPVGELDVPHRHRHVLHRLLRLHVRRVHVPLPPQRILVGRDGRAADVDPVHHLVRRLGEPGHLSDGSDPHGHVCDELVGGVHDLDGVDERGGALERVELDGEVVLGGVHEELLHDRLVLGGEAVEEDVGVGGDGEGGGGEVEVGVLEREEVEADEVPARDGEREAVDGLVAEDPGGEVERRGHVGVGGGDLDGVLGGEKAVRLRVRLVHLAAGGDGARAAAVDEEVVLGRERRRRRRRLRAALGDRPPLPRHGRRERRRHRGGQQQRRRDHPPAAAHGGGVAYVARKTWQCIIGGGARRPLALSLWLVGPIGGEGGGGVGPGSLEEGGGEVGGLCGPMSAPSLV
ncbi:Os06g0126100 [Oryza sativa Japonica Group]|uniref:Os06g0126100 protein n=2 Tax=Oryza sativa subsp. japonica TaxID=39947 RepID=Q5VS38_ORYSJ|nr:hypothetical protein EE612_031663 [Oryza sativa]BAD67737.1 unknown protein [Oryza sativa Japonica Group]BAD67921.1 unknown protein [Oryza sativa Japonica Group]BAF18570.1 Os06g0126100 [Oryza sativa Japonica Group]BAS95925.1 Os06g0126100 [Oryza sativa Japonica Group]|eukprot:NP_001056656.1 Os06g0126100 [Oryza sativa Japonica Group]